MDVDVVLAGGGLANLLIADRLAVLRPDRSFLLIESGPAPGGNHTWSFHASDLEPATRAWVTPVARGSWAAHDVRFPALHRTLSGAYYSISSFDLAERWRLRLGERIRTGTVIRDLRPDGVTLADGSTISAGLVLDGRGWLQPASMALGYQRFYGREVRLRGPHGLVRPVIMDASVPQDGGYRFMYVLPFSPDTVLLEDTVYGDSPTVNEAAAGAAIERYAAARGWVIEATEREERGALPIPLAGRFEDLGGKADGGVPSVGVRAGLFHATTGYSLPLAARMAELVAGMPSLTTEALREPVREFARSSWETQGFFRLLNRMLFLAAWPEERYRVLQRFYGLSEGLIARFYAGRLTAMDKLRLLSGRPPVPLLRGLACLRERAAARPG